MKTSTLFAFSAFVASAFAVAPVADAPVAQVAPVADAKASIEKVEDKNIQAPAPLTPADRFFYYSAISSKALSFFLEDKLVSEAKDNEEPKMENFDAQLKELEADKERDYLKEIKATLNAKYEKLSQVFVYCQEWDILRLAADARKYKLIMAYVEKELFGDFKIEEIQKIVKMESSKTVKSIWFQFYYRVTITELPEKMLEGLRILNGRTSLIKNLKPEAVTFIAKEAKLNEEQIKAVGAKRALAASLNIFEMNKILTKFNGSYRLDVNSSASNNSTTESTFATKNFTFWAVVSVSAVLFVALAVFLGIKVLRSGSDDSDFQV